MITICNIVMFYMLSTSFDGHDKFDYQLADSKNFYTVIPKFEKADRTGLQEGLFHIRDNKYGKDFFYTIVKNSLSEEMLRSLSREGFRSRINFEMDSNGKILYTEFIIKFQDKPWLSDETLFKLYQNLKEAQFDMSKVYITTGGNSDIDPDAMAKGQKYYGRLSIPIITGFYENR